MNDKVKILLVEDDVSILKNLEILLTSEGYELTLATDGIIGLKKYKQEHYDLVILDIMLPHIDGLSVCESIRLENDTTPILFVSAKDTTEDRIVGLRKGADDYLTKPFDVEEFLLRIKNLVNKSMLLQNKSQESTAIIEFSDNIINFNTLESRNYENKVFSLSKREALLMKFLYENKDNVISRETILQKVWGYSVYPSTRTIDNFISNFRKRYEPNPISPKHFISVRGVGYKFVM